MRLWEGSRGEHHRERETRFGSISFEMKASAKLMFEMYEV